MRRIVATPSDTPARPLILLDLAGPPLPPLPDGVDGSWVEVRVERGRAAVWPVDV
ncbi:hypothetical protein ACIRD3_05545 [Kitasatospora sp. NPDC093550]|uniref:hypothetical protein n=1 Tax=Kitasatospora sp. NPDC093550 TaxID=3364089 RepID=UPI00381EB1E0